LCVCQGGGAIAQAIGLAIERRGVLAQTVA
jgi:hypothetical protein